MNLDKNTIKGIGLLAFVGVLAASGYFVAKPQIEESFKLMNETQSVVDQTAIREIRLATLQGEKENLPALSEDVNELLTHVPSSKNVTGIAQAVIEAMPPGVQLVKFSHGELVPGAPTFTVPTATLESSDPPFELITPGSLAPAPAKKDAEAKDEKAKDQPAAGIVPELATAPFILDVRASGVESLANYLDILQYQDRLITVVAVTSSSQDGGETTATIYGYAFAGSNAAIQAWENPPADEEE